jgi:hypothetical protein
MSRISFYGEFELLRTDPVNPVIPSKKTTQEGKRTWHN